ncbi:MAG: HAD family hydrolase [Paludibacter sp.]|nr:HAD family hydrolase [Paludibacter sp.]
MTELIIFDLDGTLLDTVADLANSTNFALCKCGFPAHEIATYRFFIGNGINKLFERVLPEGEKTEENILKVRSYFLDYYGKHNAEFTTPYDGILELLQRLQTAGLKMAVASNKYQQATEKLILNFFPEIKFIAVLGQRENIPTKPDPTIVEDILSIAGVERSNSLYIGDSGVDMQTAQNAGIEAIGVTWGFRLRTELEAFSPKYIVNNPYEIITLLSI